MALTSNPPIIGAVVSLLNGSGEYATVSIYDVILGRFLGRAGDGSEWEVWNITRYAGAWQSSSFRCIAAVEDDDDCFFIPAQPNVDLSLAGLV